MGLSRSSVYYRPAPTGGHDPALMTAIDAIHTELPFYGIRRIRGELLARGLAVGRQHVASLMRRMGIAAIAPRRRTSKPAPGHEIYPYLLRGLEITEAGHVWATDVTYIPMATGFCYLVAIMDSGLPVGARLASQQHPRRLLLHRGARGGPRALRRAPGLQHRSGLAVHLRGLHQRARRPRHRDQHGRP